MTAALFEDVEHGVLTIPRISGSRSPDIDDALDWDPYFGAHSRKKLAVSVVDSHANAEDANGSARRRDVAIDLGDTTVESATAQRVDGDVGDAADVDAADVGFTHVEAHPWMREVFDGHDRGAG